MDKDLKEALTELYNKYCFVLTSDPTFESTYFLIEDNQIIRIKNFQNWNDDAYSSVVFNQADRRDSDAVVVITKKSVVTGKPDDDDMQTLMNGTLNIGDHPLKDEYLVLIYMGRDGSNEALFGKVEKDPTGARYVTKQEWAQDVTTHKLGA